MLHVEDLEVRYGRVAAVRGVSLSVSEGEIVGLIGPNGAGKTSTLEAVVGLHRAPTGCVRFDGADLTGAAPEDIARKGIVLVPEGRHIFSTLTVGENLRLGLTVRRDKDAAAKDLARQLELFPILGRTFDRPAGTLSGGEQQQLAIARALLARPRLLMLDEPSLGLAPLVVDDIFQTLDALRREGTTILLVEQNATRTLELADRCYVMRTGEIALQGSRGELGRTLDLAATYLGA
jgi:branched-chain amino acid transport system ATP-binding protein